MTKIRITVDSDDIEALNAFRGRDGNHRAEAALVRLLATVGDAIAALPELGEVVTCRALTERVAKLEALLDEVPCDNAGGAGYPNPHGPGLVSSVSPGPGAEELLRASEPDPGYRDPAETRALRECLAEAIEECVEHNAARNLYTPAAKLDRWRTVLGESCDPEPEQQSQVSSTESLDGLLERLIELDSAALHDLRHVHGIAIVTNLPPDPGIAARPAIVDLVRQRILEVLAMLPLPVEPIPTPLDEVVGELELQLMHAGARIAELVKAVHAACDTAESVGPHHEKIARLRALAGDPGRASTAP